MPEGQLEHGAFGYHNETIPWGALATVRCQPEALSRSLDINFQNSFDDLDDLQFALLVLEGSGRSIALVRHLHAPNPDTIIHATFDEKESSTEIVREVTRALGLKASDVTWTRPDNP